MTYSWPGNVRELRSSFEYAFVTCRTTVIEPEDLPPDIPQKRIVETWQQPEPQERKTKQSRAERQKQELINALHRTNGNQTRAAELLGISRVTVWSRMKRYGLR